MQMTKKVNTALPRIDQSDIPFSWSKLNHSSNGWGWFSNHANLQGMVVNDVNCVLRVGYVDDGNETRGYLIELYEITDEQTYLITQEAIPSVDVPRSVAEAKTKTIATAFMRDTEELVNAHK